MQISFAPNPNRSKTNIKPNQPQFKGSIENYCKALDHAIKNQSGRLSTKETSYLTDEFLKLSDEIMTDERLLGKGYRGYVFRLDDNYAIKILNRFFNIGKDPDSSFELSPRMFGSLKTYFGETLATIGHSVKFLQNIGEHTPAGVPESLHYHFRVDIDKINDHYLNSYLPKFANVPQSSYDELAMDCARLNAISEGDYHFKIDIENPNNIVLCGDKLKLIDDLDMVPNGIPNTAGTMLDLLLYNATHQVYAPRPVYRTNEYRTMFRKIMIAAEKANLTYIDTIMDLMAFRRVIENCKPKSEWKQLYDTMRGLKYEYPEISTRLEKLNELLDKEFSN